MTTRPPAVSSSAITIPTSEDQIRDYRHNQRRLYNMQRRISPIQRRFRRTIESQISLEQQLEVSRSQRANMVPAEILYSMGFQPTQHRVYQHYSEEDILCVQESQVDLPLVTEQSQQVLRQAGFHHIHMGLVMLRLYTMHRRDTGVMALVVLRDTRWTGERSIIATMEMDLTTGTQMVYVIPDIMMTIEDFANHVELSIQTHGYENWQGGTSNLLITRMMIGRLRRPTLAGGWRDGVDKTQGKSRSRGLAIWRRG